MRGQHRLPDFSVVVWIKMNENFPTLRSEVLAAAGVSDRMALKMRATGLGSPVDECLTDFTVLTGEWVIGPELGLAA
jgi:hypothetical protein